MTLRLYDTARRAVVPFEPPHVVRMYVCGITPYDSTHLGHAATYLTYDLLIRRLEELGHEVRDVRNITDVDDSILPKARELGVPVPRARRGRDRRASTATWPRSRCARRSPSPARPSRSPRIIELVGRLLDSGHAYLSDGTVYFDVSTFPDFGKLSHYSEDRMVGSPGRAAAIPTIRTGARPLDFVLWQPSLADEPAWRAPFGVGPSRLAHRVLGDGDARARPDRRPARRRHRSRSSRTTSARSRRASRSPASRSSRHWLHSAMVSYEGEKMSKSLGNLVFVSDLLKTADPRAIRLALLRHHYRSGFEWYDTDLDEAHRAAAPPARRGRARRPVPIPRRSRSACATRSTTTSTRRTRSTRSTISRARSSRAATTRARRPCCASSARCSASTSTARSPAARRNGRATLARW